MTTVTPENAVLPAQATPVDTKPVEAPVDHVRTHGPRCFWDLRDCRWDCSRA
jgi:hypothetical protein